MSQTTRTRYLLGHDEAELARLEEQARILAPATSALLALAGVGRGMRVLDLGTGAGGVAFLAADRVGPGGSVVGVDSSPTAVAMARHRADRDRVGNVSFVEGDVRTLDRTTGLGGPFDAVVGRLVLLYVEEPVAVVRGAAHTLRPGGVLLAMEYDMTAAGAVPPLPLVSRAMGWVTGAFARTGHDPALGCRLASVLSAAGLPGPACLGVQGYLPAEDPRAAHLLAATVRTVLPMVEATGVATAAEVGIDTLEQRIQADMVAEDGAYAKPPTLVGAWARTPA